MAEPAGQSHRGGGRKGRRTVTGWLRASSGVTSRLARVVFTLLLTVLLVACGNPDAWGTAWGDDAFRSNGEQIYFTATSERSGIGYSAGPHPGAMMMQGASHLCLLSRCRRPRWCAYHAHGDDGRPNIRWVALSSQGDHHEDRTADDEQEDIGFDLEAFRMAVVEGLHPDRSPLSDAMPRWEMSGDDSTDLAEYLQSFREP